MAIPAAREPGPLVVVPVAHGGKGRFDRVRRAQVDPVFGRVVVEPEQLLEIIGDLGDRPGKRRTVARLERLDRVESVAFVLGVPDLGKRLPRSRMRRLGQRTKNIGDLVELMPTSA